MSAPPSRTAMLGAKGQNAIQYVSKLSTAALLLFGAKAVIDGELSVGELVAFNMIAGQVAQPVLRLSQLWQDFQQVQVSVERLGDILNSPEEPTPALRAQLPPPRGKIEFRNVTFRYRPDAPQVLKQISLRIAPGKVIGIVGPSGSGKSTLTKLVQRFYIPEEGQVLLDDADLAQVDPSLAAQPYRRGASGKPAVQPHHPRQYRAGQSGHAPRPGHGHRAARRRRRIHRQIAAGL